MSLVPTNQMVCTSCPKRRGDACGEDGASVESHVVSGQCPIDFYRQVQRREPVGERHVRADDPPAPRHGPGTELMKLLDRWGIRADDPGCTCRAHAAQMNRWGPDECERQTDTIVGWLRDAAKQRRLPFVDLAGRMLVRRAIRNARRGPPARPAEPNAPADDYNIARTAKRE